MLKHIEFERHGTPDSDTEQRSISPGGVTDDDTELNTPSTQRSLSPVAPERLKSPVMPSADLSSQEIRRLSNEIAHQPDIDPDFAHYAGLELLARHLAYAESLPLGSKVDLMVNGRPVTYQYRESAQFGRSLIEGHMTAMALTPEQEDDPSPPIILFHGTVVDPLSHRWAGNTWLSNFDPRGIGRSLLNWRGTGLDEQVNNFFDRYTGRGSHKAIVVGHSLGGTLANLAAIYKPNCIEKTVTFNAPAVHWYAKQQADSTPHQQRPKVWRFEPAINGAPADFIAQLGSRKDGATILMNTPPTTTLGAHSAPLFLNNAPFVNEGPGTFSERLTRAEKAGQALTQHFNEQRPYWRNLFPAHGSLAVQTIGSWFAYPLTGAVLKVFRPVIGAFRTIRVLGRSGRGLIK